MAIIVTGYTRYGPLPNPCGLDGTAVEVVTPSTTTSTTSTTTTGVPTTSTTTTTTTAAPTTSTTTTTTTAAGTTTTTSTTTTTTTVCNFYYSNIYDDTCTLVYSNVIVAPNVYLPTLNYYYRGSGLGGGTIVQFLTQTCDSATYFTTLTEPGSFSCPPPM